MLKVILAAAFLMAGGAKLMKAKPLASQFEEFGLPGWTMLAVGALEVAGVLGLLFEQTAFLAAVGLSLLVAGAVVNHAQARHPLSKSASALLLFVLSAFLSYEIW